MKKVTRKIDGVKSFEQLEDRRLMSSVQLVDGMLILHGNGHGHNRMTVSPDANGTTLYARAGKQKAHYLLKDVKSIQIVGGQKSDTIVVASTLKRNTYVRARGGNDFVQTGPGSDSIYGGEGKDSLNAGAGDDVVIGGKGADQVNAGTGDDPDKINPPSNGGGITPSELDPMAPSAQIDVLEETINAGHAIHVNGLKTALKTGTVLDAQYEWDFGDSGSRFNRLTGFNAAHAYDTPGTYTITLKVTNADGKSDVTRTRVTIMDDARRAIFVSPDGNDSNSGRDKDNPVKSFARATELVGDNTEILFQRDGTYNTSTTMLLGFKNVVVGAYGSGAKPVMKFTGGLTYDTIFATLGGEDVTIRDIAFDSKYTTLQEEGYNDGVRVAGKNISVRNCSFINVGYAINTNGQPEGFLAQDNAVTKKTGLRTYFAWVQGSDQVYIGNKVPDSVQSHVLRMAGADRVLIAYNDFTNLESTAMRPTLSLHKGSYVFVTHNKLTGSNVTLGPLDAGAGLEHKTDRAQWIVVENNTITDSPLNVNHGTAHIMIRDNVLVGDNQTDIDVKGWSDSYDRGVVDLYIVRNTGINNGQFGRFINVGSRIDGATVINNLYIAPHMQTGEMESGPMVIRTGNLNGFTLIADNVWPVPTILPYAEGGINIVGQDLNSAAYKTPAEWEAYSVVQHDQFKDVTLADRYEITLDGITAGADVAKAA